MQSRVVRFRVFFFLLTAAFLGGARLPVCAQSTNDWPAIALTRQLSGLNRPVHLTHAGDSSGRLFVVEQTGRIRLAKNGALVSTPFLDIVSRVSCCGEQGLLSIVFPPGYANKGYFYVNYTNRSGDTVVARYHVTANPDLANANNEEVILTVAQPFDNHNGGQLAFGPDGYLYIGMGDGGSGGDPQNNAQNPAALLGKLLRIDVEAGVAPYAIPSSNPYRTTSGYRGEIWALGLRNPWRFSFDRQQGDLYIGDVGQNRYEEVDFQPASSPGGENYGWRCQEGAHNFNPSGNNCSTLPLVPPIAEYDHAQGCSITGGMVYRGSRYLRLQGVYLYGDFCSGRLWGVKRDGTAWRSILLLDTPYAISTFGEDEAGELYVTDYAAGDTYLVTALAPAGVLENPQTGSSQSGIGIISGWVCEAARVEIEIDGVSQLAAAYGTSREDTRPVCGDGNNGFGLLLNWNLLGNGAHTLRALVDDALLGTAAFTVTTVSTEEFLRGAAGTYELRDFPRPGSSVTVQWQESTQNFVITGAR